MIIMTNSTLERFEAWGDAVATKNIIIALGLEKEFEELIDECYPRGLSDSLLNDLLSYDADWIFQNLGIEFTED